MKSICSIAPTIARVLGIAPPAACSAAPLEEVTGAARSRDVGRIARCLVFSPDAVGTVLVRRYASLFDPAWREAPVKVELRSVMPPKTPVCYASMFTGAEPAVHGIREYVKRAPASESIFDVVVREGLRTAIVAVKDSTLDTIFRTAGVDQFTEAYDEAVFERTAELIEAGTYRLIIAYQQRYDDTLHRGDPESDEALGAVRQHVETFLSLAALTRSAWSGSRSLITFSPDHGAHYDPVSGTGSHGEDIPEDMEVTHFFGWNV
jgi:hypothetical protein